jgi:hypothetical protein
MWVGTTCIDEFLRMVGTLLANKKIGDKATGLQMHGQFLGVRHDGAW